MLVFRRRVLSPRNFEGAILTRIMPEACKHTRKQLIAKDKDAEYVECLDCGAILEAEGLEVSITDPDEETQSLGFYVKDVGLFFSAGDDAMTVHFMARRFTGQEQGYESRFLYKRAKPESLRRLVEEAVLRLLGPRRAKVVNQ